jgi:hypothetical protein
MGCLRIFGWCLLGSLLGAIGLAALGWGIGTIDVLYGHRPPGEMQTMPEFGRAMMAMGGALLGLVAGPAVTIFCISWWGRRTDDEKAPKGPPPGP